MATLINEINILLGWQFTVSAAFFALTSFSLGLLAQERKDDLALWLMGAETEDAWSNRFVSLFDALFGGSHLSLKCFFRSGIVSICAVSVVWFSMVSAGQVRVSYSGTSFVAILIAGILVNMIADYFSLLETRWLLGKMPRNWLLQVVTLIVDFAVTATIILIVIWLAQSSGILVQDTYNPLAVGLAFSVYSAPFYSTFLTSIWTWFFILSTWVLRVATSLRFATWFDVERRSTVLLSLVLSMFVFLGTHAASFATEKDDVTGLSRLDLFVCNTAKGDICDRMSALTSNTETLSELLIYACEGGVTEQCVASGLAEYDGKPRKAYRKFEAACRGGHAQSCTVQAYFLTTGSVVEENPRLARNLNQRACNLGYDQGCVTLVKVDVVDYLLEQRERVDITPIAAPCERGNSSACTLAGALFQSGFGVEKATTLALNFFDKGCRYGDAIGCAGVGNYIESFIKLGFGSGHMPSFYDAISFYQRACDGNFFSACKLTGQLMQEHTFSDYSFEDIRELYVRACMKGDAEGCTLAGQLMVLNGFDGGEHEEVSIAKLFADGCSGGHLGGCVELGKRYNLGLGVDRDPERALSIFVDACNKGDVEACFPASALSIAQGAMTDGSQANPIHGSSCGDYAFPGCEGLNSGRRLLLPLNQDAPEILNER
ncbi:tetratricopeptide repeat protein [Sulfitobacter geojensis]|uniref:Sel1 repeat family protein n=1 Tax=Sulfitobacter geojensis TaxID=1342299 RepID=A0AAE3B833_9RHOB|nr:tetratricopeptide repeat protein [Sulfitobacter geojensis]MBM1690704.1 sel1 repeat family protein [Sulfitobacter geojensis]MBM1694770.1 sel1 repeat family protein [Sulfitobacter geojensis]MBM1707075.1 sel1 repeat family protein [Sulfitobacter geojensis]MBM1711134.1 sel1 repeat family protein [Sulfitobacter geojensis]MBM1715200.1 sel1 repeat family protein [Sulfitobacter geojensis]